MPVASGDTSQLELLKALLQQKGLLATGGNIRSIPFDETASQDAVGTTSGTLPPDSIASTGSAVRPEGPTPLIQGDKLVDPSTGQELAGGLADDWWKYLLVGGAVGGGAALADMLRKRKGGAITEGVPLVEGEVITDPLAALPDNQVPVKGEYSEVGDTLTNGRQGVAGALADRQKQLTARTMPRANPVPETDTSIIRVPDQMSDISPEEMENAKALVKQLVENRTKGNRAKARQSRFSRRAVLPTGPTDENSLLNTIIGIMRKNGATRVLPRMVP
jgi:hypothetical protein